MNGVFRNYCEGLCLLCGASGSHPWVCEEMRGR